MIEDGSDVAAELWESGRRIASSILAYPEGRAALAAARRAGRLSASAHRRALEDFEGAHQEVLIVGIEAPLARRAGVLADELALRGYGGVHLASAMLVDSDVTVVTWDLELGRAAARSGCGVAPAL